MDEIVSSEIQKKVDEIEIDKKNPNIIFFIHQKEVFKLNLKETPVKAKNVVRRNSSIGVNLKKRMKSLRKKLIKPKNFSEQNNIHEKIFSSQKHDINFFKFDKKMKYFFTHDGKIIRKYSYETSALVRSFESHKNTVVNIILTENYNFMIR